MKPQTAIGTLVVATALIPLIAPPIAADDLPANPAIDDTTLINMNVLLGFDPKVAIVDDGSVTFRNGDAGSHWPIDNAASAGAACFDAGVLASGQSITVSLEDCAAVISYRCNIHPWMQGVIVQK